MAPVQLEMTTAAVDSELTLLYAKMRGEKFKTAGPIPNPFFGKKDAQFRHPQFPIYLVTRLAGYDFEDVKAMIDRSLQAANRGKFVIDLERTGRSGNDWLRAAARFLPADRVVLDTQRPCLRSARRDRLRGLGIERPESEMIVSRISMAAGSDHDRVRFHQRADLSAPSRLVDNFDLERYCEAFLRAPPNLDRRLHS